MKTPNFLKSLFNRQYRKFLDMNYFLPQIGEFSQTISQVRGWLQYAGEVLDPSAKLELLDFLIGAVKEDLRSSTMCEMLYAPPNAEPRDWRLALNFGFRLGVKCSQTTVCSDGKTVLSSPYDPRKIFCAIRSILLSGFHSGYGHYDGIYYPELNLIAVSNGLHHSCVAAQMGQHDHYKVAVYPLADMFPDISTDGEFWYSRSKAEMKLPVFDVRVAILYELARMKYELENASAEEIKDAISEKERPASQN